MKRKWKYVTENDEKTYKDLLKGWLDRFSRGQGSIILQSGVVTLVRIVLFRTGRRPEPMARVLWGRRSYAIRFEILSKLVY
jgi:hypothetical protein